MMDRITAFALRLLAGRRAVTSLEYGLIAGAIGAVMVVGAANLGRALAAKFILLNASL